MVIKNLGLGAGAPAIGIPFFWPSSAMPNTVMDEWADMVFLKFNGATFSAATYPKLALVFPSLILPEARGEFLRIWDDGRGVDSGRTLLSAQVGSIESHTHTPSVSDGWMVSNTTLYDPNNTATGVLLRQLGDRFIDPTFKSSEYGGSETRPRNIAFNFLVRAK
ncbi:hypothetical protein [Salmonella enterica]|uniref:hypothetical protein n=2 Tax=Salmonella enterica TaxID=28901 RepID=UPI003D313D2D